MTENADIVREMRTYMGQGPARQAAGPSNAGARTRGADMEAGR